MYQLTNNREMLSRREIFEKYPDKIVGIRNMTEPDGKPENAFFSEAEVYATQELNDICLSGSIYDLEKSGDIEFTFKTVSMPNYMMGVGYCLNNSK
ncbi:MAG: hypothetical protein K1W23_07135 [Lachnospiraceae bacterium]